MIIKVVAVVSLLAANRLGLVALMVLLLLFIGWVLIGGERSALLEFEKSVVRHVARELPFLHTLNVLLVIQLLLFLGFFFLPQPLFFFNQNRLQIA